MDPPSARLACLFWLRSVLAFLAPMVTPTWQPGQEEKDILREVVTHAISKVSVHISRPRSVTSFMGSQARLHMRGYPGVPRSLGPREFLSTFGKLHWSGSLLFRATIKRLGRTSGLCCKFFSVDKHSHSCGNRDSSLLWTSRGKQDR